MNRQTVFRTLVAALDSTKILPLRSDESDTPRFQVGRLKTCPTFAAMPADFSRP